MAAADGSAYRFAGATTYGSEAGHHLHAPVVGITQTRDGKGYREVAGDGGVFSFGNAGLSGSMGAKPPNQPVIGIATDTAMGGYWLAAAASYLQSRRRRDPIPGVSSRSHRSPPVRRLRMIMAARPTGLLKVGF